MADFTLIALRDEILNDPQALGYKEAGGEWKGDQVIADLLNDPANGATIERSKVGPRELVEQIKLADWEALTAGQQRYLDLLFEGVDAINTKAGETEIRASILALFGAATTTRANMIAVVQRQGSRAEVLWGEGAKITAGDVGRAFNLVGV